MQRSAVENWLSLIPEGQQVLVLLALRSCDSLGIDDPSSIIVRELRKTALRCQIPTVCNINDLDKDNEDRDFRKLVTKMVADYAKYPINFYKRLMHAAMVIGYKHPDIKVKKRWFDVYSRMARPLHLHIESEEDLDNRLP